MVVKALHSRCRHEIERVGERRRAPALSAPALSVDQFARHAAELPGVPTAAVLRRPIVVARRPAHDVNTTALLVELRVYL